MLRGERSDGKMLRGERSDGKMLRGERSDGERFLMDIQATVLAVDDQPTNLRLLDAVLTPRGHRVVTAQSGADALTLLETEDIDIVLLDILMPGMDGYEVCRRIRSTPATEFLPVVMITASGNEQRLAALEAGADDFVTKPFDKSELLARVASLARIKRYHDTIRHQADELAAWNAELETRVAHQVSELERTNRLRRFLSPQLADLVVGDESMLRSHRREIVVLFTDLRNFTPFAETSEPEEVMGVLAEYHHAIGALIHAYEGTLERFTGDGTMVFFNDPVRCDDPAERAVRMALEIRDAVSELADGWRRRGYDLAVGIGIAQNFATLGRIGFEGRFDYAAIGSVTNLAARLCSDAGPWQVLVTDRVLAATEHVAIAEEVGDVKPKGFSRSVRVHNINALKDKEST
jgi:adenylate cyclase